MLPKCFSLVSIRFYSFYPQRFVNAHRTNSLCFTGCFTATVWYKYHTFDKELASTCVYKVETILMCFQKRLSLAWLRVCLWLICAGSNLLETQCWELSYLYWELSYLLMLSILREALLWSFWIVFVWDVYQRLLAVTLPLTLFNKLVAEDETRKYHSHKLQMIFLIAIHSVSLQPIVVRRSVCV